LPQQDQHYLLSPENNLTTSRDKDENYFPFFSSLNRTKVAKAAKTSHPTSELVVSLQINIEWKDKFVLK
jgi:hypothetical protein